MKNSVLKWQLAGVIFTAAAGTLLHYLYVWTGQSVLAAPFSGVNESTWEHMKLFFWPMFFFAIIERGSLASFCPNFWWAKLAGTLTGLFFIPALFYSYTGAFGTMISWINIGIFYVSVLLAFLMSGHIMRRSCGRLRIGAASVILLCLIAMAFVVFTGFTPQIPLFRDPVTGAYGIS